MTQNRWRSKVVWVTVATLVALLMTNYGLWQYIGMEEGVFTQVVELVLAIASAVGILNNPEVADKF